MNARGDARGRGDNAARPSCYLCETPKMPWSVIDSLPNLPEGNVVCRSCVNFEGVDRIGEVIMETVRQKREYSAIYQQQPMPSNGGESGRDRLRRINTQQGPERVQQGQPRPVVDRGEGRPVVEQRGGYSMERPPPQRTQVPMPSITQTRGIGNFPSAANPAQLQQQGNRSAHIPSHMGKPRGVQSNPMFNVGTPINHPRNNPLPRMPPSITPVTSVPSRGEPIRIQAPQGSIPGLPQTSMPVVTSVPISPGPPGANGPPPTALQVAPGTGLFL